MIVERSAGVIVYREDLFGSRAYLLLDYGRHWDFSKGHVETGESDRAAALRELREETGLDAVILRDGFAREISYVFRERRRVIRKTVVFFLGQTTDEHVTLSDEHAAFCWLELDEAIRRVTYASARDLLRCADEFLSRS
jgi:8-oxo-dGTP pyrophosphatase MutT (NUDIX family)